jgi:DNA-binding NtrC family response regulator
VRDGTFREDLFYRLDVIRMNVPPLRERPEDILFLFGHFTKRLAKHYGLDPPTFSDPFLDALLGFDWPGNVRQLQNFAERLVLARPQHALTADDFERLHSATRADRMSTTGSRAASKNPPTVDTARSLQDNLTPVVEQLEREYLELVLRQNDGRVGVAARQAGISRRTMLRKMNRYGIDKQQYKD